LFKINIYSEKVEQELVLHKKISKELNIYDFVFTNVFPYFYALEDLVYF